jgi:hypothetical protein
MNTIQVSGQAFQGQSGFDYQQFQTQHGQNGYLNCEILEQNGDQYKVRPLDSSYAKITPLWVDRNQTQTDQSGRTSTASSG